MRSIHRLVLLAVALSASTAALAAGPFTAGIYTGNGFRGNYSPGYGPTHGYPNVTTSVRGLGYNDYVGRRSTGYYPNGTTRYHYTAPRTTFGRSYDPYRSGNYGRFDTRRGISPYQPVLPRYYQPGYRYVR